MTITGRGRWLVAACLAVIVALAAAGWQARIHWSARNPRPDLTTTVGSTVTSHGATFRIDKVQVARQLPAEEQGDPPVKAPAGAVIVLITLTTEIVDDSVKPDDNLCETTLIDPDGRTWRTGNDDITYNLKRPAALSCAGSSDHRIRAHHPLQVGFSYLIPATAADTFRIRMDIGTGGDDDYLVDFTR
ncbi:hypothetical protein FOE78_16095 [Microlunatus elymi]|uniref:DUF4352 domain-containing protein n=1 Tax=Microlunatus elymi TaxID=2596828 RepID=A0A516Q203_9ACTN|nr:hypothetical protein [Microlunatus elymi]QDP97241.1 hypothetical protein FOE78_16095 [Microlunatus elymi]